MKPSVAASRPVGGMLSSEIIVGLGLFWSCQLTYSNTVSTSGYVLYFGAMCLCFAVMCLDIRGMRLMALFERPAVVAVAYVLYAAQSLLGLSLGGMADALILIVSACSFAFIQLAWYYTIGSRATQPNGRCDYLLIAAACLTGFAATALVESFAPLIGAMAPLAMRAGAAALHCHVVATAPISWLNASPERESTQHKVNWRPEYRMLFVVLIFGLVFALSPAQSLSTSASGTVSTWSLLGSITGPALTIVAYLATGSNDAAKSRRSTRQLFELFPAVAIAGLTGIAFGVLDENWSHFIFSFAYGFFFVFLNAYIVDSANLAGRHYRSIFVSGLIAMPYYLGILIASVVSVAIFGSAESASANNVLMFTVSLLALAGSTAFTQFADKNNGSDEPRGGSAEAPVARGVHEVGADLARRYQLSERESEVLLYLLQGWPHKKIADELVVSPGTIKAHAKSIYKKTGVHSRTELLELMEL